jgi:hypothetical protein
VELCYKCGNGERILWKWGMKNTLDGGDESEKICIPKEKKK